MGIKVSFPLVEEPETYEDPDFDRGLQTNILLTCYQHVTGGDASLCGAATKCFTEWQQHKPFGDSEAISFTKEIHEINLNFTYDVIQNRIRSIKETASYKKMCQHWDESVERLQKIYPQWTTNDLLHLKGQFELFDLNGDFLLDFNEFNAALDMIHDDKKKETRKQLFRQADRNHYNSINFNEYLQLMHEINAGAKVPVTPCVNPDAQDPATCKLVGKFAEMDPFQQMCYNLF